MIRPPPTSPLFPYTTLFRSREILGVQVTTTEDGAGWLGFFRDLTARGLRGVRLVTSDAHGEVAEEPEPAGAVLRSEEHTSELQSPVHLVCRLLLEKKKE